MRDLKATERQERARAAAPSAILVTSQPFRHRPIDAAQDDNGDFVKWADGTSRGASIGHPA
jgi:hypothetical protein